MKLLSLMLCMATSYLTAQSAPEALARAERAYQGVTTLRAEFVQTIDNPMLGKPEVATGTVFIGRPDRFAMRFTSPAGDRLVADGEWLWAYTPSTVPGQVIRQPIPREGALTPNLFAQFVERPLERYHATDAGADSVEGMAVSNVRLVPRSADVPFREAVIAIDSAGMLRRIDLVEESGQRRKLVFRELKTGVTIPAAEFQFKVPRGVRVATP